MCIRDRKKTWLQKTAMAIFCGASGYMVVGLANDSSVCVAPLFWILMGLGFAGNHMIKRSKAKEEDCLLYTSVIVSVIRQKSFVSRGSTFHFGPRRTEVPRTSCATPV